MEQQIAFHILEIEETKQEECIQDAYRTLLRQNNPEDNPEGFKKLREAYEVALNYARMEEETEEEETEQTEIDLWIKQIDELYQDITKRCHVELWEKLLKQPLCEDLDTSLEAREAFLVYVMDHIYLPTKVWQLIEQTFQIVEDKQHLEEKFPSDFLDFVIRQFEKDQFIEYSLFQVLDEDTLEPNIDADSYIHHYFAIKRMIDRKEIKEANKLEECRETLEHLKAFGIYHPYENVERLRLLCEIMEEIEEEETELRKEDLKYKGSYIGISQLMDSLLSNYGTDRYVLAVCGYAKWLLGEYDEASPLFETLLEQYPNQYIANLYLARCLCEKKEYTEAKKHIERILRVDADEEAKELLYQINEKLILSYEETIQTNYKECFEDSIELAWCYLQNEQIKKAISILEQLIPTKEQENEYFNVYSRALYEDDQYEQAILYLKQYFACICEITLDNEEEKQKNYDRKFRTLSILLECYFNLDDIEQALFYAKELEKIANNQNDLVSSILYRARIYFENQQYEMCIDVCDEVLKKDNQCYSAYLYRQEAAFKLYKAQQVIDDYYNATSVFSGYYKPYLLAAQVFFFYEQFEDAKDVIERARENGVVFSDNMKLYEAKILKSLATNEEELEKVSELLEHLSETVNEEDTDIEDISEIYYNIGKCYWNMDRKEEAVEYFEKTLEYQDGFRDTLELISNYYKEKYENKYDKKDYEKSISYMTRQLTFKPNAYYYNERGRIHLKAQHLEEAIEDFNKDLELDKESWAAHNNIGFSYKQMGEYEKAIKYLEKAIECMKKSGSRIVTYTNLAECYWILREHRKAIACYEKNLELFPDRKSIYVEIAHKYKDLQEYDKAIEYYNKYKEDKSYYNNLGNVYFAQGKKELAIQMYEEGIRRANKEKKAEKIGNFAYFYLTYVRDYEKALALYEEALKETTDYSTLWDLELGAVLVCFVMGKKELAKKYARKAVEDFKKADMGTEENYLNSYNQPVGLMNFAWIYIGLGEVEKGLQMFHDMGTCTRCSYCVHKKCFEGYHSLGIYYEAIGDYEKALDCYEKAYAINEFLLSVRISIEEIKKKIKERRKN